MKHKINITLALLALVILVSVQAYIINQLYSLKNKEFDQDYVQEVYIAFDLFQNEKGEQPFDSLLIKLNNYADEILIQYPEFELEQAEVQEKILNGAQRIMGNSTSLTSYLTNYLKQKNLEFDFSSGYRIKEFSLIDFGKSLNIKELDENIPYENHKSTFSHTVTAEYNYCHVTFEFFIDFTHKRVVILREMKVILLSIFFTITIVFVVYLLTVRSLLQQKKLSELKSDFINNMTHELKTPLSTISVASSGLNIIDSKSPDLQVINLTGIIKRQIKLLNKMIDQILDISMLERAGFVVKKETFEIVSFMEDLLKDFKLKNSDKEVTVHFKHNLKGSRFVEMDKFQMNRVLINLLSNSVKYCEEKPVIRLEIEKNEGYLKIKIKDNGIGIPKRDQAFIFSKFYRASNPNIPGTKGLGLGLYFVKKIVEAHNGGIVVDSKPGKGSLFIISISL